MNEQPPQARSLARRPPLRADRSRLVPVGAVGAVVLLACAVTLLLNPGARHTSFSLLATAWQLPGDTDTLTARRAAAQAAPHWRPPPGASWQWLPSEPVDVTPPVDVYDLPLADTTPATITEIHAQGAHAVCRFPIGIISTRDPHRAGLDPTLLGNPVVGHPDERYLDLRRLDLLRPLLAARVDDCWATGFDGVDATGLDTFFTPGPDGVGFPVGLADQVAIAHLVADLAHARGLAVGLHVGATAAASDAFVSDVEQVTDFAVVDRCVGGVGGRPPGCGPFASYPRHGKAVLHVEYLEDYPGATAATARTALDQFCPAVRPLGFSSILKNGNTNGGSADPAWKADCPAR